MLSNLQGLLTFYGLPLPHTLVEVPDAKPPTSLPDGVKFEMHSLPVRITFLSKHILEIL